MARYIDTDKIEYTETMVGRDEYAGYRAVAFKSDIDEMPTADVVPRSEVEEIFAEIEFEIANLDFDRDETRAIAIEGIIANAKKKYTEEGG